MTAHHPEDGFVVGFRHSIPPPRYQSYEAYDFTGEVYIPLSHLHFLVEQPDVRICRIRLSGETHAIAEDN